jgi:hypothetical protein
VWLTLEGATSAAEMLQLREKEATTLYVRAPEIILGGSMSTSMDLWSLGVVSLALLVASLVFWRPQGQEAKVIGLVMADEQTPGMESMGSRETRHGGKSGGKAVTSVLANIVAFLGPLTEAKWPGFTELRRAKVFKCVLDGKALHPAPRDFLADGKLVPRRLAVDDEAASFVLELLQWNPELRLKAKHCLNHAFLAKPLLPSRVAESLVEGLSEDRLRALVLRSVSAGEAITMHALVEPHQPPAKRAKQAPAVAASQGASGGCKPTPEASSVLAAASQASSGGSPTRCACNANCGQKDCKGQKNAMRSKKHNSTGGFCHRLPVGDATYCVFCKCEKCEKPRQSSFGNGRWCSGCGKTAAPWKKGCYSNIHGSFKLVRVGDACAMLTAEHAFASSLAPPPDVVAWQWFCDQILRQRGLDSFADLRSPGDWTFLFLVVAIQWPFVVEQAFVLLEGGKPSEMTAGQWRAYLLAALRWAAKNGGLEMPGASRGRGLLVLAQELQIVRQDAEVAIDELTDESALPSEDTKNLESLMAAVRNMVGGDVWRWPARVEKGSKPSDATIAFGAALEAFIGRSQAASTRLEAKVCRLQGRQSRSMIACRLLQMWERKFGDDVWDNIPFKTLRRWAGCVAALPALRRFEAMACKVIRKMFGLGPLLLEDILVSWHKELSARGERVAFDGNYAAILNDVRAAADAFADASLGVVAESQDRPRYDSAVPLPESWGVSQR